MINKKASVLMISLWILSILVILAISLGHRAVISLKLARNQRDGLKAYLYAKSGINKAVVLLKEDAIDAVTKEYDSVDACGVNLQDKEPKDFFAQQFENGIGSFMVSYPESSDEFIYGLKDEYGKVNININTTAPANELERQVIIDLFTSRGVDNAAELVDIIIAWINPVPDLEAMPKAKKENFILLEELLLVFEYYYKEVKKYLPEDAREEAQSTYAKIKDLLRAAGDNKININTASSEVIEIFTSVYAKNAALSQADDVEAYLSAANNLAEKISGYIAEHPFKNSSELEIFFNDLTDEEKKTADVLKGILEVKSDFFRIESTGISGQIEKKITAIYNRQEQRFVYWKEE